MLKAACPGGTFTHYDRKLHRADFCEAHLHGSNARFAAFLATKLRCVGLRRQRDGHSIVGRAETGKGDADCTALVL
jgi:hypothetical protein